MLRNIINKMKQAPRKTLGVILFLLVLAAIPAAAVIAGFGPNRPVYDYNKPCNPNDNDPYDRCGSLEGPVFNSFINTPHYGDERNFVRVAPVVEGMAPNGVDYTENVAVQPGKEYWVRTFVHNNANQSTNNEDGVAKDVHVKLLLPEEVGNGVDVMTHITSSNAKQDKIWDTGTLVNNSQKFSVNYVPGSAKIYNQAHINGMALNDDIMNAPKGAKIGYQNMDGNLPGCFEFSAYVYVKVKIAAPQIKFDKKVRLEGQGPADWKSEIHAKRGDRVEYVLDFKNTGSAVARNLILEDQLPSNVELVPGSVEWVDSNRPNGTPVTDSYLFDKGRGFGVGNYGVNGGGYIYFDAKVKDTVDECVAKNVAHIRGDNIPKTEDDAVIIIDDCQPPVVNPVYSCDALRATRISRFEYKFDTEATAENGAEIVSYTYDFGDNSTPLTTDKDSVNHTYAEPGQYATKVTVNVDVNGETKTATSEECMVTISIPKNPENCPIPGKEHLPKDSKECKEKPTTPEELPNTGAGAVAGIVGAVTAAGTAAHVAVTRRRR